MSKPQPAHRIDSSAAELAAKAMTMTGIYDIADADIVEPLERLLVSLNTEAQLSASGAVAMEQRLLRILCNRLRMLRDFRDHTEINEQQIVRPLILTGGARTGSTKLFELMAASGDFKSILFWQGHNLALRSGDRLEDPAERIREAGEYIEWFDQHAPAAKSIHDYNLFEPEEETLIYEHGAFEFFLSSKVFIPSYTMWFATQDFRRQLAFFVRALKYLQWQFHDGDPRPWVLKYPAYQGKEPLLREFFPDAVLVTTHRDPTATITSSASLFSAYQKAYSDAARDAILGQMMLEGLAYSMRSFLDAIDQHPNLNRLDVSYAEQLQSPERVVEKIYAHAGMPFGDRARQTIRGWESNHAQHKYGAHKYTPEDFAFTRGMVEEKCKPYIDRFKQYF